MDEYAAHIRDIHSKRFEAFEIPSLRVGTIDAGGRRRTRR